MGELVERNKQIAFRINLNALCGGGGGGGCRRDVDYSVQQD